MLRLVLDTNVWLDWLVFDDPGVAPLKKAVAAGTASVYINRECEQELERVLAYRRPRTTLDAAAQSACLSACRRISHAVESSSSGQSANAALPRCRDVDDQKFLELARDCGAHVLVTKDHALLELARRKTAALIPFRILVPKAVEEMLASFESAA